MKSRYALQQRSAGIRYGDGLAFYKKLADERYCLKHKIIFNESCPQCVIEDMLKKGGEN